MPEQFEIEKNGKKITLVVREPTIEDGNKARNIYRKEFAEGLKNGGILRLNLEKIAREQGIWNDEKEEQQRKIDEQLADKTIKLKSGGIKLSEAKQLAVDIRNLRNERRNLLSEKSSLDTHTIEGQADNARFNSLVSSCLVYKDNGKSYYSSMEEYLNNAGNEEAFKAAQLLAKMLYGLDEKFEENLPENQFLKKYKFINDDLNYVNKEGKMVDEEGRLIDENGRYIKIINGEKKFVDKFGRLVDENGQYVVEEKPFLDDEGNPIVEDENPVMPESGQSEQPT